MSICWKMETFCFNLKMMRRLTKMGISTHYIDSDLNAGTMTVHPATFFGKGVEFICRLKATGSFLRRYGDYCIEGRDLNFLVELTYFS